MTSSATWERCTDSARKVGGPQTRPAQKGLKLKSRAALQSRDALLDWRVRHEEPPEAAAAAAGDAERLHGLRQLGLAMHALQAAQRLDHRVASGKLRAARVGAELALPREPHHDH